MKIFYRWHALYSRRLRQQYGEQRAAGEVVRVEVTPGVRMVVAAWMLDAPPVQAWNWVLPAHRCAALADLHRLLSQRGLRRSSCGVFNTDREGNMTRPPRSHRCCQHHRPRRRRAN